MSVVDEHGTTGKRLHEPFLERAAAMEETSGGSSLAGFLVMRLVDQFADRHQRVLRVALTYQVTSTRDFVSNLSPQTVETGHLLEIARVALTALSRDEPRLLSAPTLAFAWWLEQEARLPEALDALETAGDLVQGQGGDEEVAAWLSLGRVARRLGRYADATPAYRRAARIAGRLGDRHSVLLSRIGRGIVLQQTGKLPESRRLLRAVIRDAVRAGDQDAEARGNHALGTTLLLTDRPADAAVAAFRAFDLYVVPDQRLGALYDLALAFLEAGVYPGAREALCLIVESVPPLEFRADAMIQLLDVAAQSGDRLAFERWRRALEELRSDLPPEVDLEVSINVGLGLAELGETSAARTAWQQAGALARTHDLEGYRLEAEDLLERGPPPDIFGEQIRERASRKRAQLEEIAERLRMLRAAGGVSAA